MDDDDYSSSSADSSRSNCVVSVEENRSSKSISSDEISVAISPVVRRLKHRKPTLKRTTADGKNDSTDDDDNASSPIKWYCRERRRNAGNASCSTSGVARVLLQYDEEGDQESSFAPIQETVEVDRNSSPSLSSSNSSRSSGSDMPYSKSDDSEGTSDRNSDTGCLQDSASDSEVTENVLEDDFLYPGSNKRRDSVVLELLECYFKNKWTRKSLHDSLNVITSCLPSNHNMPKTIFTLFQYVKAFSSSKTRVIEHYYCADNLHVHDSNDEVCSMCDCTQINLFYELPIEDLIKYLFEHRQLSELVENYHSKVQSKADNTDTIFDITDGTEYKRVREACSGRYDLTLVLNTDGIKPHISSQAKLWPIMFTIMEITPELRSSFVLVTGVWFDPKKKPDMQIFLEPFVNSLKKVFSEGGVRWQHPKTGVEHTSQVFAPLIVADAPARADVQGIQGHNSKYACNLCEQKTNKLARTVVGPGIRRPARLRRFLMKDQPAKLRSHERMIAQGNLVLKQNAIQAKGVKKIPIISSIPLLDLSTCLVPEYMHSVLKGVVLQFTLLWFTVKGDWYIGNCRDDVDKFLLSEIHPPDFITRLPRSVSEVTYWKANELRSWLLYYSLIVTSQYMHERYVQHWMLLVAAIFILLQDEILKNDLDRAELLLRMFVRDVGSLYKNSEYVYNVHQLLHLRLSVERWGPLWSNSAFMYEGFNGVLSRMVHGTQKRGKKLVNQILISQGTQILRNRMMVRENLLVDNCFKPVGKHLKYHLSEDEKTLLSLSEPTQITMFGRCSFRKEVYSSEAYDRNFKRRNSYVMFNLEGQKTFGRIRCFFKLHDTAADVFCIIKTMKIDRRNFCHLATRVRVSHMIPVSENNVFVTCNMKDIITKVIQVGSFLCLRPDKIEENL